MFRVLSLPPHHPSPYQTPTPTAVNFRIRLQDFIKSSDADSAALVITNAGSSGFGSATTIAAATAAVEQVSAGKTDTVAESFAVAAAGNTAATAAVLARAAVQSRSGGNTEVFARSQVCLRLDHACICHSVILQGLTSAAQWCMCRLYSCLPGSSARHQGESWHSDQCFKLRLSCIQVQRGAHPWSTQHHATGS
jgi:hypothetical protein